MTTQTIPYESKRKVECARCKQPRGYHAKGLCQSCYSAISYYRRKGKAVPKSRIVQESRVGKRNYECPKYLDICLPIAARAGKDLICKGCEHEHDYVPIEFDYRHYVRSEAEHLPWAVSPDIKKGG